MNQNTAAAKDDDEIVFKIKRSAIADALRSDFEMPIPVTDANIEVVVNQITALIDEFPTGVPTEFFDLGIDHHKGIDFYRRIYDLLGDINGPCCGTAWASEDSSLVYFAVADRGNELSVLHFPASALEGLDSPALSHEDLFDVLGAVQDLHVGDAYAESDAVAEFARTSRAAASFRPSVLVWARDGELDLEVVKRFATDPYAREKRAIRGLSDAQLESEIAKAAAALDSKPRHLRSPELQHRSVMLRTEKARRLHESRSCEMERGGAATRRPWPPRPRRPRLSATAAPSSTEATSISKPAAGNASRRPIR